MINKNLILLLLILIFALFLRLPQILADDFFFVFDMGRDMLWTRDIAVLHKPSLIGPWGSLQGIFFGPLWYYLLSVPFLISHGDPRGSVLLVLFINLITIIIAYLFGKKIKDEKLGLIFALLLASSTLMIDISTYAFHSNLLPFTTLIFIWSLYEVLENKLKYLPLAALMASLNFHFEPATAIFTVLTLAVFVIWKIKLILQSENSGGVKIIFLSLIAFIIPFIPQIIFELRHEFLQTQSLILFIKGENKSLGGVLPFIPRAFDRAGKFLELFSGSVFSTYILWLLRPALAVVLFLVFLIYRSVGKKERDFIEINLLVLLVPFLAYIFLFPPELKGWYLTGLAIPYILLTGLLIRYLLEKNKVVAILVLLVMVIYNSALVIRMNYFLGKIPNIGESGMLSVQKEVIDWIYKDADKLAFNAYLYTAPVYDYNYQYLFWWYGKKQYGYWPQEYSYLPGKIDYVPYKDKYIARQRNQQPQKQPDLIYLIIEPDIFQDRIDGWLGSFSENKLINSKKIGENVIEKRLP